MCCSDSCSSANCSAWLTGCSSELLSSFNARHLSLDATILELHHQECISSTDKLTSAPALRFLANLLSMMGFLIKP